MMNPYYYRLASADDSDGWNRYHAWAWANNGGVTQVYIYRPEGRGDGILIPFTPKHVPGEFPFDEYLEQIETARAIIALGGNP